MAKSRILNNAKEKIRYFNKIGIHYEAVYHYVIRRRDETKELYVPNNVIKESEI